MILWNIQKIQNCKNNNVKMQLKKPMNHIHCQFQLKSICQLLKVLNNPQSLVERNQANNPPPNGSKTFRSRVINKKATMREWYIAWTGYVEGIAEALGLEYTSKLKNT